LVADNVLSTLGRNIFEFEHFRPDFYELSQHPYMKNYNCSDYKEDSVEHLLSSSFSKRRFRRSTDNINVTEKTIDAEDKTIEVQKIQEVSLGLEIKFKIPLFQVYESTFVNFNVPINFKVPLYEMTHISARDWNNEMQPALDDLEGIVSMLGLDGRSCVLRAVCEISESPFMRPEGIVGEMLEVFVNYLTMETPETNELNGGEVILSRRRRDYHEATVKGRDVGGCEDHYSTCPISLFNIKTAAGQLF